MRYFRENAPVEHTRSFWTLHNFIRKHGLARLIQVLHDLRDGKSLDYIGRYLKLDKSSVSRFVSYAFTKTWDLHPEIKEMLEEYAEELKLKQDEIKRELGTTNVYPLRSVNDKDSEQVKF